MGIELKIDEKTGVLTSDSDALKGRGKTFTQHERGTTLVEVAVAGALLVLALASLYALYGTTVKEAKGGDTAAIAEQNSIARIDQMRNLTWNNTTSPSSIATLLTTPTSSDNAATISREVISISSGTDSISKSDAGFHPVLFRDQDRHSNARRQPLGPDQHSR